jgi:hypothetical protein
MYPTPTQEKINSASFLGRISQSCETGRVSRDMLSRFYADGENVFSKFVYAIPAKVDEEFKMLLADMQEYNSIDPKFSEYIHLSPFGYAVVVDGAPTIMYRVGKDVDVILNSEWCIPLQGNSIKIIQQVANFYDHTTATQRMKFLFGYTNQRKNAEVFVDSYMEMFHPEVKITL